MNPTCYSSFQSWFSLVSIFFNRMHIRADSRFVPSRWETSLQCNAVSHWLGANLETAPYTYAFGYVWSLQYWKHIIFTGGGHDHIHQRDLFYWYTLSKVRASTGNYYVTFHFFLWVAITYPPIIANNDLAKGLVKPVFNSEHIYNFIWT